MRKIKYYIAAIIFLVSCYWWFGYREMSLVEYYVTVDYYEKLKEEDIEKIDKENELVYYVDFGSAAEIGLMYMLKELNRCKSIVGVMITSFIE